MVGKFYDYGLAPTSQFFFCSLPLRMDTYSECGFNCAYCFAKSRGGNRSESSTKLIDVAGFERRIDRVLNQQVVQSVVDEFIARQHPIHLGGMADPFPNHEAKHRVTEKILRILARFQYPVVVSTKSDLVAKPPYLGLLKSNRKTLVQFSISSLDPLAKKIEIGTPGNSRLLSAASTLSSAGIAVSCRIQPIIPTLEKSILDLIRACAENGIFHVGLEHLKIPIEKNWWGGFYLDKVLGFGLREYYQTRGSVQIGRELILPIADRLPLLLEGRSLAHRMGLSFASADTDLLPMSDSECCCSGADLIPGFENFFKANFLHLIRKTLGRDKKDLVFSEITKEWLPSRSISRYVNSHSRLNGENSFFSHLENAWNRGGSNSPEGFWGVEKSEFRGKVSYKITKEAFKVWNHKG